MTQLSISGKIHSEPKVLKLSPLLIFVKVSDKQGTIHNCLVHQHGLNFLDQASLGSRVALLGHRNSRHQFVITRFTVIASSTVAAS